MLKQKIPLSYTSHVFLKDMFLQGFILIVTWLSMIYWIILQHITTH